MSLVISKAVLESHATRVATVIGKGMFSTLLLQGFYKWFDDRIRSGVAEKKRFENARDVLDSFGKTNTAAHTAVWRVVRANPELLGSYAFTRQPVPNSLTLRTVFEQLTNKSGDFSHFSEDQLMELLNSIVTIVGFEAESEKDGVFLTRDEVADVVLSKLPSGLRMIVKEHRVPIGVL